MTAPGKRRPAPRGRREPHLWYLLGYFLLGLHVVAFAVTHAVRRAE